MYSFVVPIVSVAILVWAIFPEIRDAYNARANKKALERYDRDWHRNINN